MCGNKKISEFPSPDMQWKIIVFQRDCGATTGFSTQASLVSASTALPSSSGNVFVADTDHGRAPSGEKGGPELKVAWNNIRSVTLSYHPQARVFLKAQRLNGIDVNCETFK